MAKLKAAVIFGGANSEHEVSWRSAASVIRSISADKYDVVTLGITKDGRWYQYFGTADQIEDGSWITDTAHCVPAYISPDRAIHGIVRDRGDGSCEHERLDVVLPILHGKNGEDGTIQGLFEIAGIPYIGCGVLASAMCMDKAVTNTLLDDIGIRRAPWDSIMEYDLGRFDEFADCWEQEFGYPMFVKPANAGSSVGITKAADRVHLRQALDTAFEHDNKVVVEQNISGQELECSVLGHYEPIASIVGEIIAANEFYDYESKYHSAKSETLIPARITAGQQAEIQRTAVSAFLALGCKGMARVDFLMDSETKEIYLNEINTIPGFTSISMYSKMLEASGIPYPELIDRLINIALE